MAREDMFKTVSFGGYDKSTVENYISDLKKEHQSDIADLKATISKLSATVKDLQQLGENNNAQSAEDVEKLMMANEGLRQQLEDAKKQVEECKNRELSFADKYDAISKTLIESRERADFTLMQAQEQAQELLEKAKQESEAMLTQAKTDRDMILKNTQDECRLKITEAEQKSKTMLDDAAIEKDNMLEEARAEALRIQDAMKHECENVNTYMASLMESVEGVMKACQDTKRISAQGVNTFSEKKD